MGYEYAELDAAARGLVLALLQYRDGASVGQLAEEVYEDEPVPLASAAELVKLGYVDRREVEECTVLELMDRGWRWVEETAQIRPTVRAKSPAFADADTTELIGWALFYDFMAFMDRRGETIADLFPVEELRPLRLIRNTRTETVS